MSSVSCHTLSVWYCSTYPSKSSLVLIQIILKFNVLEFFVIYLILIVSLCVCYNFTKLKGNSNKCMFNSTHICDKTKSLEERDGSVVERLTQDPRVVGLSLMGGTALCA